MQKYIHFLNLECPRDWLGSLFDLTKSNEPTLS